MRNKLERSPDADRPIGNNQEPVRRIEENGPGKPDVAGSLETLKGTLTTEGVRKDSGNELRERRSSVTRLVGDMSEAKREQIRNNHDEHFRDQSMYRSAHREKNRRRWARTTEREKTPEEVQVLSIVNDATNHLLRKYGLDAFDVPPDNIHIMKRNLLMKVREFVSFRKREGGFIQDLEAAEIVDPISLSALAATALHELIHFKSYGALQRKTDDTKWLDDYRVGLEVSSRDGKTTYFKSLNEAVTEELTKRMLSDILRHPIFQKERERTEKLKNHPILRFLHPPDEEAYYVGYTGIGKFAFGQEREMLNDLIDGIYVNNRDMFRQRDEVFEVFVRAMMTGNILPLGRLIEKTFGKGSFRTWSE